MECSQASGDGTVGLGAGAVSLQSANYQMDAAGRRGWEGAGGKEGGELAEMGSPEDRAGGAVEAVTGVGVAGADVTSASEDADFEAALESESASNEEEMEASNAGMGVEPESKIAEEEELR